MPGDVRHPESRHGQEPQQRHRPEEAPDEARPVALHGEEPDEQPTAWFERQLIDTQIVGEFKLTPEVALEVRLALQAEELLERFEDIEVVGDAANGRLGVDTAFDTGQIKIGRRLAIKVLNASKFVLDREVVPGEVTEPLDRAMLAGLASLVEDATASFEGYDYTRALERTERFFWGFCDNYLELVKNRAYGNQGEAAAGSAHRALREALSVLLRLFAPFLPYVTEEVWSWWQEGSVHRSSWPDAAALRALAADGDPLVLDVASEVLGEVRKAKTAAKVSLRAAVQKAIVRDTAARRAALARAEVDLCTAANITTLEAVDAEAFAVEAEMAPVEPAA